MLSFCASLKTPLRSGLRHSISSNLKALSHDHLPLINQLCDVNTSSRNESSFVTNIFLNNMIGSNSRSFNINSITTNYSQRGFGTRNSSRNFTEEQTEDLTLENNIGKQQSSTSNVNLTNLSDNSKLDNFNLRPDTIKHLNAQGITHLFPIQVATYDNVIKGNDLIARDRTGSGKTLGYILPLLDKLRNEGLLQEKFRQKPLALVVLPTRELVIQVTGVLNKNRLFNNEYRVASVYGGTSIQTQIQEIQRGVEVIVGTPGRLIDLAERGEIDFTELKMIILDEADQMLDMGFQDDIEEIYRAIHSQVERANLQSVLFSATIPSWVQDVARKYLREGKTIKVDLVKDQGYKIPTTIKHLAIQCPYSRRNDAIGDIVLCYGGQHARTIIFTETKKEANDILIESHISQECQVLHGDIPQQQREITFKAFREGKFKCLIATNVAARGLDIPEVDLIIQLSPPKDADTYVHRAGRTARAGRTGVCVTLYTNEERDTLQRLEREAKFKFQKTGAPQPSDIFEATKRDIGASIDQVPHDVVGLFSDVSKDLIERLGGEEALSRALAIISGTNKKRKQRSLLSSREGYITYQVEAQQGVYNPSSVYDLLRKRFHSDLVEGVKDVSIFEQKDGAAFDVPEEFEKDVEDFIANNSGSEDLIFSKATALPEFISRSSFQRSSSRNSSYNQGGSRSSGGFRSNQNRNRDFAPQSTDGKDLYKVCIKGLSENANEHTLEQFFKSDGLTPQETRVLKGENGNTRGIAFVKFRTREDAALALRQSGQSLEGQRLRIEYANERPARSF